MVFLTCAEGFRSVSCRYFSKWLLKIFSSSNLRPTHPWTLMAYNTPCFCLFVCLFFCFCFCFCFVLFFHQNDCKGCKRDYLDARSHFVWRFVAIGDKPLGGGNHPLGRRKKY